MAVSSQPKGDIDVTLTVADNTGTPVTLTLPYTLGGEVLDGLRDVRNEATVVTARGRRVGVALGDLIIPTITIEGLATQWAAAAAPGSMADWCLRRGVYASNVSTLGASSPWAFKLTITQEGTNWGDASDGSVVCNDVIVDRFSWTSAPNGGSKFTAVLKITGTVTGDLASAGIT